MKEEGIRTSNAKTFTVTALDPVRRVIYTVGNRENQCAVRDWAVSRAAYGLT
jgi:hypothetical protein